MPLLDVCIREVSGNACNELPVTEARDQNTLMITDMTGDVSRFLEEA
jgi:hypothetical protein